MDRFRNLSLTEVRVACTHLLQCSRAYPLTHQLITLALQALKEATTDPISDMSCSVAVVGDGSPFRILEHEELRAFITRLELL